MKYIFSDQHHLSLYNSLRLLFENRLGYTLLRPIGREWVEKGHWRMAEVYKNSPVTIEQYLGIKDLQPDENGIYHPYDQEYDYYQNAITLDQFFKMPINIVIASLPEHIESFGVLCDLHPSKPKLIYQVGNAWNIQEGRAKNILASAIIKDVPLDTNIVTYHQEFDLNIFKPGTSSWETKIYSFINCLPTAEHYQKDWWEFLELEAALPEWEFKSFGASCRDGAMHGPQALADKIREAAFVWHVKKFGDGYGHILYNAFACGKPIITRISDYKGKLGEELLTDGETCIDLDAHSFEEVVSMIRDMAPHQYEFMCQQAYQKFKNCVDFDREETAIRQFLSKVV